jgi:hypothetical protein
MTRIILSFFILSSIVSFAQDSNILANTSVNRVTTRQLRLYNGGDAYLQEEWKMGKVIYGNGTSSYLPINYNGYNERLEWLKDGQALTFDNPVNAFILADTSLANGYLFMSGFYPVDKQTAYTFYQVLYQSPTSRLLKYVQYKTLEKRNFNEANLNVKFEPYESYYFADATNHLTKIKANKKSLFEIFPEKATALDKYMDEEGIKIKDWDDFINVIGHAEMMK